jgi:hypothetical protein
VLITLIGGIGSRGKHRARNPEHRQCTDHPQLRHGSPRYASTRKPYTIAIIARLDRAIQ